MDDRELAERCLSGDQTAIREFVERFQGMIFAFCLRQLRHREDAEDVAQQSLVRAVRHLRHWDPNRPLNPWVLTIAVNRCRTHASQKNYRTRSFDPAMDAAAREQYLAQHAVNEQRRLQAMFVEEFARHRERRTAQERKRVADMSEEERVAHRSAAATRMRVCKVQP